MVTASIFISAILSNNFVLKKFLGICPFLGVSKKIDSAASMGMAVTFVMTIATAITWPIYKFLLEPRGMVFLQTIIFILVIASLVQFVEMVIRKVSPPIYQALGIYLPLITTNCAILGLTLEAVKYSFITALVYGIGAGLGFTLAIVLMAGIREHLETSDVPNAFKGVGITLIAAGILALAFLGFSGIGQ